MNEDPTKNMVDERSFEERVFARFDSLDNRLIGIEPRLEKLKHQAERQAIETKPIWERALAEIMGVKNDVRNVERKVELLHSDMLQFRADQLGLERRVNEIESKPS